MSQEQESGVEMPVVMAHKTLTPEQRGWSASEREGWGLCWALHTKLHPYVFGHHEVVVYTDHKPLLGIFQKASTNAKLRRWANILAMYSLKVVHQCGVDMGPADALSRCPGDTPATLAKLREETPEDRSQMCTEQGPLHRMENTGPADAARGKYRVPQQRLAFLQAPDCGAGSSVLGALDMDRDKIEEQEHTGPEPASSEKVESAVEAAESYSVKQPGRWALEAPKVQKQKGRSKRLCNVGARTQV